ncbi:YHS domain-containing (seleno)protein [uncultured Polaribacter sp.]|uniref:YHS domain-containing (seleno)protein n=1 Tax=uncultured Polaribacter sp. TaxID=174711 RepID=UPI00263711F3|nr:YHS domain-containing (seleno)protein [uncultured Polaribacter sp.]
MKKLLTILVFTITANLLAQEYNIQNGYMAQGFDVVSYFSNTAVEGKKQYTTTYNGVKFKFVSQKNLNAFKSNPTKYMPQCGGYCAYAVATRTERKEIDPEYFEIRDGKLYLFYNAWFFNKKESWLEENPEKLKVEAAKNWEVLKNKKD